MNTDVLASVSLTLPLECFVWLTCMKSRAYQERVWGRTEDLGEIDSMRQAVHAYEDNLDPRSYEAAYLMAGATPDEVNAIRAFGEAFMDVYARQMSDLLDVENIATKEWDSVLVQASSLYHTLCLGWFKEWGFV
ncbi:MAG: hypothetical protein IT430_09010 [Phycisphaerales bacterium]|nr:hypothetical protein [Phycisphaerales bacterium]